MKKTAVHGCSGVNTQTVWDTLREDIPALRQEFSAVLGELN